MWLRPLAADGRAKALAKRPSASRGGRKDGGRIAIAGGAPKPHGTRGDRTERISKEPDLESVSYVC